MGGGVDGHAKCERHPYRATGYSVADTAQALIKLVHSSDSRYQPCPPFKAIPPYLVSLHSKPLTG